MEFNCTNCGHKLAVAETLAGKKGRCPRCKEIVAVPCPAEQQRDPVYDPRLLDIPEPTASETPTPLETDTTADAYERLRGALGGRLTEPEEIPKRRYPWFLDVLLYPVNSAALVILLICVGTPFLLRALVQICKVLTIHVPVMLILWVLSLVLHWAALGVLLLYMNWYVVQSVRDSAQGGIRAPETGAMTPGFGDILGESFRLIVCALVCMAPAFVYWTRTARIDQVFWAFYAIGGIALPMALLTVITYESLRGLNPILIIRSILRTLLHYCVLVPLFYVLCLTLPLAFSLILNPRYWHWSYILQALAFYQLLIVAHLLGRFYWKNEEKLDWNA